MEEKYVLINNNNEYGTVNINTRALEVIAAHATKEIKGISKMYGKISKAITESFNRGNSRGSEVQIRDKGIIVDLYVNILHGESIHKIAKAVQETVSQAILSMAALKVSKVYVHVVDIDA